MRIVFFGNNKLACDVLTFLREQGETIVGLVLHPKTRQKFGEELIRRAELAPECVFSADQLSEEATRTRVSELHPDMGISVLFGYILKKPVLGLFPRGCINLHPAYLPYNRGAYPNVWSIVDGTPAGVTIHRIDEGVDTGAILAQRKVEVLPTDTGMSLYQRLEHESLKLFKASWPDIKTNKLKPQEQAPGGTSHKIKDVVAIDEIQLDEMYSGRQLIDIIRARTFPPFKGAYFLHNGRRIYLRLELLDEATLD